MLFVRFLQILPIALGVSAATDAYPSSRYPVMRNDVQCPEGYVSFVHNSYTYLAPLHKFKDITKSFFDIAWYSGTIVYNSTGTDNVPGATRAGFYSGGWFNETLTAYISHSDTLEYTFHGQEAAYIAPTGDKSLFFGYTETMRIESICDGQATYIDLITYMCSDNQTLGYSSWYNLHMVTFEVLAANVSALVMAGDCPCAF
ncbi:hypothetical protein MVEN_01293600 [Mycena venus]|uniref:Uncharacterized protein n=1 Tax=Mycena venus TaxID=2733690 RepID=A0A8H7CTL7_9AGAR|nr:hypothetical protein MVEN_01293600 [Mycena venus]